VSSQAHAEPLQIAVDALVIKEYELARDLGGSLFPEFDVLFRGKKIESRMNYGAVIGESSRRKREQQENQENNSRKRRFLSEIEMSCASVR
jgi:hypothetical protein